MTTTLVFRPYEADTVPATGAGILPALTAAGMSGAPWMASPMWAYGHRRLPRLRASGASLGWTSHAVGLPRLRAAGRSEAGAWGAGRLPAMTGGGTMGDVGLNFTYGGASVAGIGGGGTVAIVYPATHDADMPALRAFASSEPLTFGRAALPAVEALGVQFAPFESDVTLWGSPGYIAAFSPDMVMLTDVLDLGDDMRIAGYLIRLRDNLRLQDTQRSILSAALAMEDPLYLRDTLQVVYLIVMQDVLELDGSLTATQHYLQRLVDTLLLEGVVDTELDATVLLASTLLLTDAGQAPWFVGLQSALEVGDDVELSVRMVAQLIDSLLVGDQLDMTLTMHAYLSDSLPMSDGFGSQLGARVVLQSALEMFGRLTINGDTWACYVMNTESKGIGRFTNYPFNSFAKLPNGQWIGATDTGLHLIGGDTDAGEPITARIRSALTDFGSRHLKRVPNMYIGYTADGQVGLKVVHTSERGGKTEDHYLLEPRDASDVRESRYKIGRGIASVFLGFELVNIGGADFALDVVEWLPLRLDRRVR